MTRRLKSVLLTSLSAFTLVLAASDCEIGVNVNAPLDASLLTSIDCAICADVSVDATYDSPDVSIYGVQPVDAGNDARRDAEAKDATVPHD